LQDRHDEIARDRDDESVHGSGNIDDGRVALDAENFFTFRIYRIELSPVAKLFEILRQSGGPGGIFRCADERDGFGIEERS
jgi:hypothetical protein